MHQRLIHIFIFFLLSSSNVKSQQLLDEAQSAKAAKQAIKFYKKEQLGEAMDLMYNQYQKINSKKLKPGLKKKYLDAKKALKKYRNSHLPLIHALQRTEKALEEKDYLTAIGLHYFKVEEDKVFPATKVKYDKLFPQIESIYKSIEDTLINKEITAYKEVYLKTALSRKDEYTGDIDQCIAGNVPWEVKLRLLKRANYFRRLAGINEITYLDTTRSDKAQESSLMMASNGKLSHDTDSSWKCYTKAGAAQAGSSSLSLTTNTMAITGLILDRGDQNKRVGHRTNLLYPHGDRCSIGLVKSGYGGWALTFDVWFSGGFWYKESPYYKKYVTYSWPQRGIIPAPILADRWSFSAINLGGSFEKVKVNVYDEQGKAMTCEMDHKGYQHIVWQIAGLDKYDLKENRWFYVSLTNIPENDEGITVIEYPVLIIGTNNLP